MDGSGNSQIEVMILLGFGGKNNQIFSKMLSSLEFLIFFQEGEIYFLKAYFWLFTQGSLLVRLRAQ